MSHPGSLPAARLAGCGALALLLACAFARPTSAQTQGGADALSLDRALELSVERSRLVEAARQQTQASREMKISAAQLPDPVLKVGIDNLPVNGPDQFSTTRDFMTQRSIGVMQEFTRDEKRRARAQRFEREAEVGEAQRALTTAQVRRDAAAAWLDRSYRESSKALLESEAKEAELQVDAADSAYRASRGSQADVFAARTQLEQIRDRIGQAEQAIATATAQLSRWIGGDAERPLAGRPAFDAAPVRKAAIDERISRHPQLAVLAGQEAMAQAEADIARANRRPDWSLELTYSQRGSGYSNMVSFNVSVPVPWDRPRRQDRELAARLAQREQAQAEKDDARRALDADARSTSQQWNIERSRLVRYDRTLIPLADARVAAALAAYRAGNTGLSTVLEARRSAIEIKLDRLNIDQDAARLWVQLGYLASTEERGYAAEP